MAQVEKLTIADVGDNTTRVATTLADLKMRVAEHIIAQDDCHPTDEVQSILAETKVGTWRRKVLLKKLQKVFSLD